LRPGAGDRSGSSVLPARFRDVGTVENLRRHERRERRLDSGRRATRVRSGSQGRRGREPVARLRNQVAADAEPT
jgi:hypothetical protein